MARFVVVTTPELGPGFKLAGAEVHLASGVEEALQILDGLIADAEVGVVGVHGPFLDGLDPAQRSRLDDLVAPVVVAVPSGAVGGAPSEHRARLAGMLQRAIGHRISFGEGEER